ncbi:MAG: hypothetical protein B7Z39_02670 [Novosphingobium sp. 12-64-8]|nr:MAG: hypothetical protein B7Z39_02670 [Novosphingobium sp. 12-64-8]
MNRLILFALLIMIIVVVIAPNLGHQAERVTVASVRAEKDVAVAAVERPVVGGGSTVIERDGGGQFHVSAEVDGQEVRFLVDTGADLVALTEADAARLGLSPDPGSFQPTLRTASGTGYGAPVRLERMSVGGRDLDDVEAVVVRGLSVSLLGQSVLRQLGSVTLEGDRLLISD